MWSGRSEMIKSFRSPSPFLREDFQSNRSKALSERENSPEKFLKRITPQILEVYEKGLPYQTPEEWDDSFALLGGGQSRRSSSAILSRMTWDQFLEYFSKIISNKRT